MKQLDNSSVASLQSTKGISLVELMVAMVIGLVLMGGLLQLSFSHKNSYGFQQSQSANQENIRFAYYYLETIGGRAGYMTKPQNAEASIFPAVGADARCSAFTAGQVITQSLEGAGICIRFQRADATETDCLGNAIASANAFVTRLYLDAATNELMCGAQGVAAAPLVSDIESMQLTYGISTTPDLLGKSIETYMTTPASDAWEDVVAVRFSMLASQASDHASVPQTYTFPLDSQASVTGTVGRVYYTGQKTITLRNAVL